MQTTQITSSAILVGPLITAPQNIYIEQQIPGIETITLYSPVINPARSARKWLTLVCIVAAISSLIPLPTIWQAIWWMIGLVIALIVRTEPKRRDEITLFFPEEGYTLRYGKESHLQTLRGNFSDITCVRATSLVFSNTPTYTYQAFLDFTDRPPLRIDNKICDARLTHSYNKADHLYSMKFLTEIAARLNVPLIDESGWRGSGNALSHTESIVVHPGETHPVFLHDWS